MSQPAAQDPATTPTGATSPAILAGAVALLGLGALVLLSFPGSTPGTGTQSAGAPNAEARGLSPEAKSRLPASAGSDDSRQAPGAAGASATSTWSAAARTYQLSYTDAQGQETVQTIRFDPSAKGVDVQLQGQEKWSYPLALSEAELGAQSDLAKQFRVLLDQAARPSPAGKAQRLRLPTGGWVEAKRQIKELPRRSEAGEPCRGASTLADLRGKTRSGERFKGQLKAELWVAAKGGALVALRVKQTLTFADRGDRSIAFSLRPLAPERKVGSRKVDSGRFAEGERRVATLESSPGAPGALPASLAAEAGPTLAVFGSGLLLILCLSLLARWLGPSSALCVFLSLAIVATPLALQAQDKTSFGDRFSDPTENEVAGTVLAGLAVGVGAVFAFVSAPVWVPVAVGVAGVTAIGAYWFTRTPPIRKGTISDKRFEPARTYLTYVSTIVPDGNGGTTTILVPKVVHDDADYVIQINAGEEHSKVYVTANQFKGLKVGQTFDMDTMGGNRFDDHDSRRATAAELARLKAAEAKGEASVPLDGIKGALEGN